MAIIIYNWMSTARSQFTVHLYTKKVTLRPGDESQEGYVTGGKKNKTIKKLQCNFKFVPSQFSMHLNVTFN